MRGQHKEQLPDTGPFPEHSAILSVDFPKALGIASDQMECSFCRASTDQQPLDRGPFPQHSVVLSVGFPTASGFRFNQTECLFCRASTEQQPLDRGPFPAHEPHRHHQRQVSPGLCSRIPHTGSPGPEQWDHKPAQPPWKGGSPPPRHAALTVILK